MFETAFSLSIQTLINIYFCFAHQQMVHEFQQMLTRSRMIISCLPTKLSHWTYSVNDIPTKCRVMQTNCNGPGCDCSCSLVFAEFFRESIFFASSHFSLAVVWRFGRFFSHHFHCRSFNFIACRSWNTKFLQHICSSGFPIQCMRRKYNKRQTKTRVRMVWGNVSMMMMVMASGKNSKRQYKPLMDKHRARIRAQWHRDFSFCIYTLSTLDTEVQSALKCPEKYSKRNSLSDP